MEKLEAREMWLHTGWDEQERREFIGAHLNELSGHCLDKIAGIVSEGTGILPIFIDDAYPESAKEVW